jgi:hypothetical protein
MGHDQFAIDAEPVTGADMRRHAEVLIPAMRRGKQPTSSSSIDPADGAPRLNTTPHDVIRGQWRLGWLAKLPVDLIMFPSFHVLLFLLFLPALGFRPSSSRRSGPVAGAASRHSFYSAAEAGSIADCSIAAGILATDISERATWLRS